jgi:pyruvate-formate lyase-activating enzyme
MHRQQGYTPGEDMASTDPNPGPSDSAEASHTTKGLLRLTMACNEACPFCNVPQEDYPKPTPPFERVLDELDGFIQRGDRTLTISGGEPTLLRSRLLELIRRAKAGGIAFIELQTNAVLVDAEYAEALRSAGLTSAFVSLLSHLPEHHDALAGLAGAFPRCLRGIDAMLDHGIRVTLNPVTAKQTEDLVADYVAFVASRLPRVQSISMSAVQPHGRAQTATDLLPDYSRLAPQIRAARSVASKAGIDLLNPYCGLPLCVGWEDGLAVSVEAIEAMVGSDPQGIDNSGNKRHGPACMDCALRPRCGGAWHAYWEHREGRGLSAPIEVSPPWAQPGAAQTTVTAWGGADATTWERLGASDQPSRWLWTDALHSRDIPMMRSVALSHLALRLPLHDAQSAKPALAAARKLIRSNALMKPQAQIQVHLEWPVPKDTLSAQQIEDAILLAQAIGAHALTLTGVGATQHRDRLERHSGSIRLSAVAG